MLIGLRSISNRPKEEAMMVVRDVYQARYGMGDELVALFKENQATRPELFGEGRILTDASGRFFTVVTEMEVESFAEWELLGSKAAADPEFGDWFARMQPLVETGRREFYQIQ